MTLDSTLWSSSLGGGLYRIVRCGLVHEYFMKADSSITIGTSSSTSCGITYNPTASPKLIFNAGTYFEHFKNAFSGYYNDLVGTASAVPISKLQTHFDNAYQHLPLYSVASGLASVSGSSYTTFGSTGKGP
jgi:hypothetical protein